MLGKDHLNTLESVNNLVALLDSKGNYADAEPLYHRLIVGLFRIAQQTGQQHPHFRVVEENYIKLLMRTGISQDQALLKIQNMLSSNL